MSQNRAFIIEVLVESKITKEELDLFLRIEETSPLEALASAETDFAESYAHYFHPIEYRVYPIH